MRKKPWYPIIISERIEWLENSKIKFPGIAPDFKFTPAEITDHLNDLDWCIYGYRIALYIEIRYHEITAFKEDILEGDNSMDVELNPFTPLTAPTSSIKQGAEVRIKNRMHQIKSDKTQYTDDVGKSLRIIGTDDDFDPEKITAVIRSITVHDDKVSISYFNPHCS